MRNPSVQVECEFRACTFMFVQVIPLPLGIYQMHWLREYHTSWGILGQTLLELQRTACASDLRRGVWSAWGVVFCNRSGLHVQGQVRRFKAYVSDGKHTRLDDRRSSSSSSSNSNSLKSKRTWKAKVLDFLWHLCRRRGWYLPRVSHQPLRQADHKNANNLSGYDHWEWKKSIGSSNNRNNGNGHTDSVTFSFLAFCWGWCMWLIKQVRTRALSWGSKTKDKRDTLEQLVLT